MLPAIATCAQFQADFQTSMSSVPPETSVRTVKEWPKQADKLWWHVKSHSLVKSSTLRGAGLMRSEAYTILRAIPKTWQPATTHFCKEGTINYKTPTHCDLKAISPEPDPRTVCSISTNSKTIGCVWRSWRERVFFKLIMVKISPFWKNDDLKHLDSLSQAKPKLLL